MNDKNITAKKIARKKMFLDADVLRMDVSNIQTAKNIGKLIGMNIVDSFKNGTPVKEIFLYGGYGSGKSSMSRYILSGFDNSDGCTIKRQTRMECIDTTFPKCRHIDYRLHSKNPSIWLFIPEYRTPKISEDEVLIGEWCEFLSEDYFYPDMLAIEMIDAANIEDAKMKTSYLVPINEGQKMAFDLAMDQPKARMMSIVGFGSGKELVSKISEHEECKGILV